MKLKKLCFLLLTLSVSLVLQAQAEEKKIAAPSFVKNISKYHLTAAAKGVGSLACVLGSLAWACYEKNHLTRCLKAKNHEETFCARLLRYSALNIVLMYVALKLGESCLNDLQKIIKKRWNRAQHTTE